MVNDTIHTQWYLLCVHPWTALLTREAHRPQPYQYCSLERSSSEKCLGAEISGFHPGGVESCTDGRVEGEVIFTSHCLVCTISDLTQPCLWLALTGAQPSLLPLDLSRTMCTHWAEARTRHHKYSRRQLAIISHHAINNHVLQLLTVPLWSYLGSEMFSMGFHMLSVNSGPMFRQKIWIHLQNRGLVTN